MARDVTAEKVAAERLRATEEALRACRSTRFFTALAMRLFSFRALVAAIQSMQTTETAVMEKMGEMTICCASRSEIPHPGSFQYIVV